MLQKSFRPPRPDHILRIEVTTRKIEYIARELFVVRLENEAGFCYAEGIGCKKDLKKAAKFYRKAEAKGVSMIGNSW